MTESARALRNVSIFGALEDATIEFLLERCSTTQVSAGEMFFRQGESGDAFFVLRQGRVSVVREVGEESLVLAELERGDCFGEMALVGISPRSASVRALVDCEALRLKNLSLLELADHDIQQFALVQMNLGREVARRLEAADAALIEQARQFGRTAAERAALARAACWPGDDPDTGPGGQGA